MAETFAELKHEEETLLCRSYNRYPVAIVRGEGTHLWDLEGREYLDLLSGIGVIALGHCNPSLCDVLARQSHKLWHVSNLFYQEEQLKLAKILLSTTHHDRAFFCNSGAEANEAAIKLARRHMCHVKKRDASGIITLEGCFHGRTLGTLAATGRDSLADGFHPLPKGFKQVPPENLEALSLAMTPDTAAVLLECVQGEGGVIPLSREYLQGVEKMCRERDVLLICDEVQSGMCRTGRFWSFQHAGIRPDAITVAKALANGMAMGAMLATEEMAKGFEPGSHATTFGGGALVSAVAAEVVRIMLEDDIAPRVASVGEEFKKNLEKLAGRYPDQIREVRGMGLMIGIELLQDAQAVWRKLLAAGYICNIAHGRTLRLLPPLVIAGEELHKFTKALAEVLEAMKNVENQ